VSRASCSIEAFDWVLAYRQVLPAWTQTIAVSKTVQTVLKTQGLSRATPAVVQADTHLGPSMLARRRRALRPDMKTA